MEVSNDPLSPTHTAAGWPMHGRSLRVVVILPKVDWDDYLSDRLNLMLWNQSPLNQDDDLIRIAAFINFNNLSFNDLKF
jgi:hypothetical protein